MKTLHSKGISDFINFYQSLSLPPSLFTFRVDNFKYKRIKGLSACDQDGDKQGPDLFFNLK